MDQPEGEDPVEEVGLVGMDEEATEPGSQGPPGVVPVAGALDKPLEDGPLEAESKRESLEGRSEVPAPRQVPAGLLGIRGLPGPVEGEVGPEGTGEVSPDEELADAVGHRPLEAEPLGAEIIGHTPCVTDGIEDGIGPCASLLRGVGAD